MKFAVIGGTGLIGSQVVQDLNAAGHEAVPHGLSTGVDVLTGQGLDAALAGADVVVNLTNSPTFDDASPAFFQTSMEIYGPDTGTLYNVAACLHGLGEDPAAAAMLRKVLEYDPGNDPARTMLAECESDAVKIEPEFASNPG